MVVDNISGTTSNSFSVGNLASIDGNISFIAKTGTSNNPTIRWNSYAGQWEYSADGITFSPFGTSTGGGVDWKPLTAGVDYNAIPINDQSLTMITDQTEIIYSGVPLRLLDGYGVKYGDDREQLANFYKLTGITSSILDSGGKLYFTVVNLDGNYRIDIYNRAARTTRIAHSNSYRWNYLGDITITEDSGSGINGYLTIINLSAARATIYVEFYKWVLALGCTDSLLAIVGPPFNVAHSNILEMWSGSTTRTQLIQFFIPGNYSLLATSTLLTDFLFMYHGYMWMAGKARIVAFKLVANAVSSINKIMVNISNTGGLLCTSNSGKGLEISSAHHGYSTNVDINPIKTALYAGAYIEVSTTQGDLIGIYDSDLSIVVVIVWE